MPGHDREHKIRLNDHYADLAMALARHHDVPVAVLLRALLVRALEDYPMLDDPPRADRQGSRRGGL